MTKLPIDAAMNRIQMAPYDAPANKNIISDKTETITTPHTMNPIPLAILPAYTCPRPVNRNDKIAASPALFKGLWYWYAYGGAPAYPLF